VELKIDPKEPPTLVDDTGDETTLKNLPRHVLDNSISSQVDNKISVLRAKLDDLRGTLTASDKKIDEFHTKMEAAGKWNAELFDQNKVLREHIEELNTQQEELMRINEELSNLVNRIHGTEAQLDSECARIDKTFRAPPSIERSAANISKARQNMINAKNMQTEFERVDFHRNILELLDDINAPSGMLSWIELLEIFGDDGKRIYKSDMDCAVELLLEGEDAKILIVDLRDKLTDLLDAEPYRPRLKKAVSKVIENMITRTLDFARGGFSGMCKKRQG